MDRSPPADWTVPRRTIVIATLQRSGSNLLGELMGQTGLLGKPGEFFNPYALRSVYPGRGKTLVDRCLLARQFGATPNNVIAIKLFPEYMPSRQSGLRFSEWFGKPVWVWLRRRDLVGQAISLVLARQQFSYTANNAPQREPTYSAETIFRTITELATRNAKWEAYFTRTGILPLPVDYRDLEAMPDKVVRAVAVEAEIDLGDFQLLPPQQFQKQRTALNDEWRERFIKEMGDPDLFALPKPRGLSGLLHRLRSK